VVVAKRDYSDMLDAYEIRLALESLAIRRLVADRGGAALEELRAATKRASLGIRAGDTDAFRHASISFHERLTAAAGSALLRQFAERLASLWFFFPQDPRRMAEAQKDHITVIEAIGKGDAEGAIRVLRRHFEDNIAVLRETRDKAERLVATARAPGQTKRAGPAKKGRKRS
jgi:DNA-binding GntR family transcriptional regulator